ncbi:putative lipase/esterase [Desulfamplus magnetovallimortis]|uniref:Putative lipase/esterase n=1 Tax=Desulfamplus magnetovallimortis TaxID=1246637 RepID=A0A1W1H4X4_9BACT|nr:alpha/beta hydrolase [Desulfamplus magnetovallimortis]SLM27507.1 putative lipase/esterase [Desulfamplus magnetovallimortis]
MTTANINGMQIEFETFGNPSSPTLLLITGLGCQMIHWQKELCEKIAEKGLHVIRYDNRDSGFSTKITGITMSEAMEKAGRLFMGMGVEVPYSIENMAEDAVGLLDFLKIEKAHICGMSMGGFIAQTVAINYTDRLLSLISIYSSPGNRREFMPSQEVMEFMMNPAPAERSAYIEHSIKYLTLISGKKIPLDEEYLRNLACEAYDRSFYPDGVIRQYLAILSQKDRGSSLGKVNVPALVIHGDEDPMIPMAAGKATAEALPDSKLKIIKGMGHDMPQLNRYWSEIVDAMAEHAMKLS